MFGTALSISPVDIPFLILGLYFIITSWIDIRTHEVPDWLSYSLTALGIAFAATRTILLWNNDLAFLAQEWTIVWSVLGAAVGLGLGAILYYTGQWGGGDAKLLMGTGAILGLNVQRIITAIGSGSVWDLPAFLFFLVLVLVCGAVYGVIWMLALIALKPKQFWPPFRAAVKRLRWQRYTLLGVVIALLAAGAFVWVRNGPLLAAPVLGLAALIVFAAALSLAVQTVETTLMRKRVTPKHLVEGDWVVGGLKVGKKWLIGKGTVSVSAEQIMQAQRGAPKAIVTVKLGIPFVPSFFFAYVALFFLAFM